ncbi:MAG TPA: tetratricopeptide repeat protein [Verrucomicrobiae bacterium]|jgi:tetratricopeptide (TPR) repeat protein
MTEILHYLIGWFHHPLAALFLIFQLWMFVDAIRRDEWYWAFLVWVPFMAVIYFFLVFRAAPSATQGFELPGAGRRSRIKELERQIHNLDKPHHYLELGDIYFQNGNLAKAEQNYTAAIVRDPNDIDIRAHLGQCLLRQKRVDEASALLYKVCTENPRHDYGYSLMAYAEALQQMGNTDGAISVWKEVLASHSYARARVQLGQLYLQKNESQLAQAELSGAIHDDRHAPGYQRKRDRVWIRTAKSLL